jgi:hypothetical protein
MTVASLPDVVARLGRQPLPDEETLLRARLADAQAAIERRIPDAATLATTDARFRANLVAVTCDVALRSSGIPSRLDAIVPQPGVVENLSDGLPGFVSVRGEEWRRLGVHVMDVWNPYPSPYGTALTPDQLGYLAGWHSGLSNDDCY